MTNPLPTATNPLTGHTVMQMLDVAMSSIIGDYDDADQVPQWQWVKQMASHEHVGVKDDSAYEYTLNLAMELDATPPALQPLITGRSELHSVLQRLAAATVPPSLINKQHKGAGPWHHWNYRT